MTKRERALWKARGAGYHGDAKAFTRLLIEERVNRTAMNRAWTEGVAAKRSGMGCKCYECSKQGEVNREECSLSKRGRQQSATSALPLGDGVRSTPRVIAEERFDSYHPSHDTRSSGDRTP